jgi:hypothetical protein
MFIVLFAGFSSMHLFFFAGALCCCHKIMHIPWKQDTLHKCGIILRIKKQFTRSTLMKFKLCISKICTYFIRFLYSARIFCWDTTVFKFSIQKVYSNIRQKWRADMFRQDFFCSANLLV